MIAIVFKTSFIKKIQDPIVQSKSPNMPFVYFVFSPVRSCHAIHFVFFHNIAGNEAAMRHEKVQIQLKSTFFFSSTIDTLFYQYFFSFITERHTKL